MTKEEMDELGTMAMKVINNVELTEEEELRFVELSAKLEELDATTSGPILEGDGACTIKPIIDRHDSNKELL